jgi:hypothetical protein
MHIKVQSKIKHKNKLELFDSYNTLGVTNSLPVSYLSLLSCFSPFLKFNFKLSFCFPISRISFSHFIYQEQNIRKYELQIVLFPLTNSYFKAW